MVSATSGKGGSRMEIVSPEGLRVDGRRPEEVRRFSVQIGTFEGANGSAYVEMGHTKCLVAVYGPKEVKKEISKKLWKGLSATVQVEYSLASFSSGSVKTKMRRDRKLIETASLIRQALEPVILLSSYPRSEIEIFVQILQMDGGAVSAAINAACLALMDAGIAMTDFIVCCSAGFANDQTILDLNYIEEGADTPVIEVAYLPRSEKVVMLNMETRLHMDHLPSILELAIDGCKGLFDSMESALRKDLISKIPSAMES